MSKWRKHLFRSVPREPLWLVTALVIVGGSWVFVELSEEVLSGDTQAFDEWVVRSLRQDGDLSRPIGPKWFAEATRDATGLGGAFGSLLVTSGVAGFLWISRGYRTLILLLVSIGTGVVLSFLLKEVFERPRPNIVPHLSEVSSSSFPSGHSMVSAVVYLTLAAIVSTTLTNRLLKVYVFLIAFLMIALIGFSRVYLGVHYPTDVLAGWTAGIVWALFAWEVMNWLMRRGAIEPVE